MLKPDIKKVLQLLHCAEIKAMNSIKPTNMGVYIHIYNIDTHIKKLSQIDYQLKKLIFFSACHSFTSDMPCCFSVVSFGGGRGVSSMPEIEVKRFTTNYSEFFQYMPGHY